MVARIHEANATYGLKKSDLFGSGFERGARQAGKTKIKLSTKPAYGDEQGNAWVGRGPRPRWLREAIESGKSLEHFKL